MRGPYILRVDGTDYAPSSFGKLRDHHGAEIWNPDQLYRDAQLAAMRVAAEFEQDVEVVGRIGTGGKDEVLASRFHVYREGDFVFVSLPTGFNYVRYARPA